MLADDILILPKIPREGDARGSDSRPDPLWSSRPPHLKSKGGAHDSVLPCRGKKQTITVMKLSVISWRLIVQQEPKLAGWIRLLDFRIRLKQKVQKLEKQDSVVHFSHLRCRTRNVLKVGVKGDSNLGR